MKNCAMCKTLKHDIDFYKKGDRRSKYCKTCHDIVERDRIDILKLKYGNSIIEHISKAKLERIKINNDILKEKRSKFKLKKLENSKRKEKIAKLTGTPVNKSQIMMMKKGYLHGISIIRPPNTLQTYMKQDKEIVASLFEVNYNTKQIPYTDDDLINKFGRTFETQYDIDVLEQVLEMKQRGL